MPMHAPHHRRLPPGWSASPPSLHEGRPPTEGLAARQDEVGHVAHQHDEAVGLDERAAGRHQSEEDNHDEGAHHPGHSLRDARHVLVDGLPAGLCAVDAPREGHREEDILHVGAQGVRNSRRRLVLLRHDDGGHGVGEGGADGADGNAEEAVGQGRDVVVDLLRDLEHDPGEDGQPEHGAGKADGPALLPVDVLDVAEEEGALEEHIDDELRDRADLVEEADVLAAPRVRQVLHRALDGRIVPVDPGPAERAFRDVLQKLVAVLLVGGLDPQGHVLQRVRELELDEALAHHDDLLEGLVVQDGAQHRVGRRVELEADGGPLLRLRALRLLIAAHRLGVDAAVRGFHDPLLGALLVTVSHAAVDNLLHLDLDAVHLAHHGFSRA
mmetsp:Transcript_37189/g.115756  ORF Transcript_37189/g.115756 Transcript_37189/m.115756 type:complete len:383 (+) Transcript_37189:2-1150(+)